MAELLYVIGIPGAGKTTLVEAALRGCQPIARHSPIAHLVYSGGIQLGALREGFSGTDALSLSAQPLVMEWLATMPYPNVLGEGDRLANRKFFRAIQSSYNLTVALLATPPELASERRAERGSHQDAVWLKGRMTKVEALMPYVSWVLDGTRPLSVLVKQFREHPVIEGLRGEDA